ncbi:glycolipid sulfotransferase [Actinoallomurus liliacearum]|uniref:Glycolipid sulfotransferase n=1 Tax=Actinoallomurus liliacearum TaxID=1080073 RepID=A0ABP8TIX0_9ACTN
MGGASGPFRHRSFDADSGRWDGFPFRDGDIVISTRPRSGTTWTQMICALLIFQTPDLPAPLGRLSPWLDHLTMPRDEVYALLARQRHRRFIKTHMPLDALPVDRRVTYIVTARQPLDLAVSLYHHTTNIDIGRMRELTGNDLPTEPSAARKTLRDWLLDWISHDADPRTNPDSLPGVMRHLGGAWARRGDGNVLLIRYEDLCRDLEGQMRGLADRLGIAVPESAWPTLVRAATFERMRGGADRYVPGGGIIKSGTSFFRRGRPGAAEEILTGEELAAYRARVASLAAPDLVAWLHAPGGSGSVRLQDRR